MSVQPHLAPRHQLWWCYVALIIAGVGPFLRTLNAPFVFDDVPAIVRNESIRDLSQLGRVLQPPAGGTNVAGRGSDNSPRRGGSIPRLNLPASRSSVWAQGIRDELRGRW